MKLILVMLCCLIGADEPPSSRIILHQTGTISNVLIKQARTQFEAYGCRRIGVMQVDAQHSNVYCLDMLVAEK